MSEQGISEENFPVDIPQLEEDESERLRCPVEVSDVGAGHLRGELPVDIDLSSRKMNRRGCGVLSR